MKMAKSDRRLMMWAGLILLPIVIALSLVPQNEEESRVPSTYSAQSPGAKAAFLLLQEQGYDAERWERPPSDLPTDAANTVLVLAYPTDYPTSEEKDALQRYLNLGGKILATGATTDFYLPMAHMEREPLPDPEWKEYEPQILSALSRAGKIKMSPSVYWDSPSLQYLVHYAKDNRPIVVSYKVGRGEVIWWGSSIPLTNAGISQSGNLGLLLNSLGPAREVHVYWDEYFHGYRRTLGSYFWDAPVLWGAAQCGFIVLAMLLTYSRRNGPIRGGGEPKRLSPLEFVHTLGGLYLRANATQAALEVPYARFRSAAARQLGLKPDVRAADLARAIHDRLGYKDKGLDETLQQIESAAYGPDLSESQTLALVQQLSRHAYNLKFISQERQETASHADNVPGARPRPH
jgi:hypothetical protein